MTKLNSSDYQEMSAKQVFEWIVTGDFSKSRFELWLRHKNIIAQCNAPKFTTAGTLIHRPGSALAFEWVKTRFWNFRKFQNWLTDSLDM